MVSLAADNATVIRVASLAAANSLHLIKVVFGLIGPFESKDFFAPEAFLSSVAVEDFDFIFCEIHHDIAYGNSTREGSKTLVETLAETAKKEEIRVIVLAPFGLASGLEQFIRTTRIGVLMWNTNSEQLLRVISE